MRWTRTLIRGIDSAIGTGAQSTPRLKDGQRGRSANKMKEEVKIPPDVLDLELLGSRHLAAFANFHWKYFYIPSLQSKSPERARRKLALTRLVVLINYPVALAMGAILVFVCIPVTWVMVWRTVTSHIDFPLWKLTLGSILMTAYGLFVTGFSIAFVIWSFAGLKYQLVLISRLRSAITPGRSRPD